MPIISMFYGIIVAMYYLDNQQHNKPHIHVKHNGEEVILEIPSGNILDGNIKAGKLKLAQAWIEIHQDELIANWELAVNGEQVYKIDPLK